LTNGTLTFGGISPPSPTLDFSAKYERSDITALIRLSGSLTSLDVLMDSEPPLPADEILSRLLFNRGVANVSPIQALQLGQALNAMVGSRSPFDVAERTRRILRVDQLDIRQSEEENGGGAVSIGKYLTDNVYVEIEKGVGTEGGRILSEVEITPNLTFESETGTDAHVGVGLNWKWDY
jgi:translocation and assembly module TamB